MALTSHQEDILEQLLVLLQNSNEVVLQGSAGVGKTFLTDELIKRLSVNVPTYKKIYVSAPTNKAVGVLNSKIDIQDRNIELITTHSALKIGMKINKNTGEKEFVPMYGEKNPPLKGVAILIIDECSMIGEKMLEYIKEHTKKQRCKIVFIGDEKQVNPVKEDNSPVFHQNYPTVELTEIIRQAEGNPIITLSRNMSSIFHYEARESLGDDGVRRGFVYSFDEEKVIEELARVNGTDELKYLAWTNEEVNLINRKVRERIYTDPKKIEQGETLIFDEPYQDYYTSEEIKIETLDVVDIIFRVITEETPTFVVKPVSLKCYVINGHEVEDIWGDGKKEWKGVFVIHEDAEKQYQSLCKVLLYSCGRKNLKHVTRHEFLNNFATTKYNHALTVHKSQGSSYQQTIVNVNNINFNPNQQEKNRILYTAITRASNLLILYKV